MNKIILRTEQHRQRAIDIISAVKLEPVMEVAVRPYKDKKTTPQIRTLYMWFSELRAFFGESQGKYYTDDEIKLWIKGLFGIIEIIDTPSGQRKRYKSYADYTLEEMMDHLDKLQHYSSSELGCFLTLPGLDDQGG